MSRFSRVAWVLCVAVMLSVIVLHAGLLPLARWQADEYFAAAVYRKLGALAFYWSRVSVWSPRPFSEALLTAYYASVAWTGRPLAARFVALLWVLLLLAGFSGFARRGGLVRLALALVLPAAFLLSGRLTEVFFWPQGAAAYLTTLAAALALFWAVADGAAAGSWRVVLPLCVAALCSETGAVLALCFLVLMLPFLAMRRVAAAGAWWLVLPAAAGLWVLVQLSRHRVGAAELPPMSGQYLHHAWPSLKEGARTLVAQVVHGGIGAVGEGSGAGLFGLVLVGGCFAAGWAELRRGRTEGVTVLPLLVLAGAFLAMAFVSVAAAYYQFDSPCCERHETLRQACLVLAAASLGAAASAAMQRRPESLGAVIGVAPLMLALLFGFLLADRWPALRAEYARIPGLMRVRTALWAQMELPGDMPLVFQGVANGPLVNGYAPPTGRYEERAADNWEIKGIQGFFKHRSVVVLPP